MKKIDHKCLRARTKAVKDYWRTKPVSINMWIINESSIHQKSELWHASLQIVIRHSPDLAKKQNHEFYSCTENPNYIKTKNFKCDVSGCKWVFVPKRHKCLHHKQMIKKTRTNKYSLEEKKIQEFFFVKKRSQNWNWILSVGVDGQRGKVPNLPAVWTETGPRMRCPKYIVESKKIGAGESIAWTILYEMAL